MQISQQNEKQIDQKYLEKHVANPWLSWKLKFKIFWDSIYHEGNKVQNMLVKIWG